MVILGVSDALRGIFTPLFTSVFGFDMTQVGVIVSASYLGNLICLLFGGMILDKIGRKKAMALFIIALALSELLLLLGSHYAMLVLGFFLALGISTLLNTTINLISDSFSATKSLMLLNALFFLQGIGTSGSQLILSHYSSSLSVWNGVLIAMAVLLIPLAIITMKLKEEKASDKTDSKTSTGSTEKMQTGMIALIALTLGLYLIAEHGITNYIIMYGTSYLQISAAEAGLALSLYSAGLMIGRLVLGTVVDRVGAEKMIFLSLAVATVVAIATFALSILPLLFIVGLAISIVYPTTVSLVRKHAPLSLGARATTIAVSAASILDVIFNAVFGKAIDSFGYGRTMPMLCAALGISAVLMILIIPKGRKQL
ncbi:MAG: MFS transporter [Spirochaetes bacterium]|uniref:MFS transporter n=1 Tax=Candidatus Ornithospirochaeta stercoripullorum TaxID=2840899 RepID=A0A9D9E0Z2_9SPIO|nr:MFS transporter [Candidatus Ornithospirochaeta stercoripullorum]